MAVKLTAAEYAEKQAARLKAALEDIRKGVNRVTVSPGTAAAAKYDKWKAALANTANQEKWKRRVAAVGLEEWKQAMSEKGIGRIAVGIDASRAKVEKFATALIAHQNAGLGKIASMPDLTLEDSIQRAAAWIRHMSTFKY